MKSQGILFFADRLPPTIGGVEMHGAYFIDYFKNHPLFPLLHTVKEELEQLPQEISPSFLFFNSGRWIERLGEIRKKFPKSFFIYRTGGNEILKASLKHNAISDYLLRRRYWVQTLNSSIDLLITNSAYTEARLQDLGIRVPFTRIVGGVNVKELSICKKTENSLLTFFCSARFVPYKNHLLLIRIFQELKKKYAIRLLLAGDGPLLVDAKQAAKNDPSITFLGALDNDSACREMSKADIYIQLSGDVETAVPGGFYIHSEGMGRSILEAISAGIFVIAGNSGALKEIITPDRGILVPLYSFENTLKAIEQVILHPPIRRQPISIYSWENVFKKYESLYESLSCYRKV